MAFQKRAWIAGLKVAVLTNAQPFSALFEQAEIVPFFRLAYEVRKPPIMTNGVRTSLWQF